MDFQTIIGIIFSTIGAISSIWFLYDKLSKRWKLSWRFVQKAVLRITDRMTGDDFSPSLIIGIGRGGAIMGAMISGALGHRPLIVIDRKYDWKDGRRVDDLVQRLKINIGLDKVLLVAGEVHSGNTMRLYYNYFQELGAKEIRRATLYYEIGSTEPVEYIGLSSSRKMIRLPWMFTDKYRRNSRSEEEAKGISNLSKA